MQEVIVLYAPGAIPGIPGESQGPGIFLVDYWNRTIEQLTTAEVPEEQTEILTAVGEEVPDA